MTTVINNHQGIRQRAAYLAQFGVIGGHRNPKFGVIGDRRRGKKPEPEKKKKKHTFMLSEVPFELDAKYVPLKVLGKGSYGVVCSCHNQETGEKVAIKKIIDALDTRYHALGTLREIQILRNTRHPNVISVKDVMVSPSGFGKADYRHVYVVQELMESDLRDVLSSKVKLSDEHVKCLMFQIVKGLKYLHEKEVIHRDLKPENLLLNSDWGLKICDFGLARTKYDEAQPMTEYTCTRWYRAPELLINAGWYGDSVDMWSTGCVLAELLGGLPIFRGADSLSQLKEIVRVLGTQDLYFVKCVKARKYMEALPRSIGMSFSGLYPDADPLAIDLLERMLVFDPWERISALGALEHPYFAGLYDPSMEGLMPLGVRLEVDEYPDRVDEETLRELIWEEMLLFHPEERSDGGSLRN